MLLAVLSLAACTQVAGPAPPPATGLVLLGLEDGNVRGSFGTLQDPSAVALAADGRTAYVSDASAGLVYALDVPRLSVRWKAVVGGRPGPLLAGLDLLLVSVRDRAAVAEIDVLTGRVASEYRVGPDPGQLALEGGRVQVACSDGRVWDLEGASRPGGRGFGLATGPGGLWSGDAPSGSLVRVDDGTRVALPGGVRPAWLAAESEGRLLVGAPGADAAPGAVFELGASLTVTRLAATLDPREVTESSRRVLVASHGDGEVRVLAAGGRAASWLRGSHPVALAPDPSTGLLLVLTNAGG